MLVFALHGFGMTGDGDELCQEIVQLANRNGAVGLAPTYPTNNPHLAYLYLSNYVENKLKYYNTDAVFAGVSLGGFWARYLANAFGTVRLILINPSLHPWQSLQPYVGMNHNFATDVQFELSPNDANAYYIYRSDDDAKAIQRNKTLYICTEDSNQDIKALFSNKRNVALHTVQHFDDILYTIKENLFSEDDGSS